MTRQKTPTLISKTFLKTWPLPDLDASADKDSRGGTLIIGGCRELPGAVLLAAEAAVRAGAGKLKVASPESIALQIGFKLPEAMSIELKSRNDALTSSSFKPLMDSVGRMSSVLIGPGLKEDRKLHSALESFISSVLKSTAKASSTSKTKSQDFPSFVFDAAALCAFKHSPTFCHSMPQPPVLTPHAGEMADLMSIEKDAVESNPDQVSREFSKQTKSVVVLKGSETHVALPDGTRFRYRGNLPGLATSGSGDVLAGLIAGLLARGASPDQAAVWGVYLHGESGRILSRSIGHVGFLARELAIQVPKLVDTCT